MVRRSRSRSHPRPRLRRLVVMAKTEIAMLQLTDLARENAALKRELARVRPKPRR